MKIAAMDLGTNSFLCLIAEGTKEAGLTKVHRDLMQVVRLGQGVDKTGELHPEALARAKACLQDFKQEIDAAGVDTILAMATSAARDAKNGHLLFDIGKELGIPIEIIPGADEARITYQGAIAGKASKNKTSLVIDVGGGSTELIVGRGSKILFGESLDIGGVRLTEKFISSQPVPESEQKIVRKSIQQAMALFLATLKSHLIDQVIAVSGTPTSIVAIELGGFEEQKVDGFSLTRDCLAYWVSQFAATSVEEKKAQYSLGGRADIIFAGSSILLGVLEALDLPALTVSTKGVRYGVALEMLQK